ncbi:UbiA family prenyltransferase [Patescibacteria group bacterium]|nr:UbiA family prenyltransferase [Patescibacteria group bacterium]
MYKKTLAWIKAGRPLSVALGVILTLVSAKIAQIHLTPWIPIFIAVAGIAIMFQNDWRDRHHDYRKGKTFVVDNEKNFLWTTVSLWVISIALICIIWIKDPQWGILSLCLTLIGLVYSEARKIPLAPGLLVSIAAAGSVVFSLIKAPQGPLVVLFLATLFFIWGRETLKDIDDMRIDFGYKWTFPVFLGAKKARMIVVFMDITAVILMLAVSSNTLIGIPFLIASIAMMFMTKSHKLTKRVGDLGIAIVLFSLLL